MRHCQGGVSLNGQLLELVPDLLEHSPLLPPPEKTADGDLCPSPGRSSGGGWPSEAKGPAAASLPRQPEGMPFRPHPEIARRLPPLPCRLLPLALAQPAAVPQLPDAVGSGEEAGEEGHPGEEHADLRSGSRCRRRSSAGRGG